MLGHPYLQLVFSSSFYPRGLFRTEIVHENSHVNCRKQNCPGGRWARSVGPALRQPATPSPAIPLWGPARTPGFGGNVGTEHPGLKSTRQRDGALVPHRLLRLVSPRRHFSVLAPARSPAPGSLRGSLPHEDRRSFQASCLRARCSLDLTRVLSNSRLPFSRWKARLGLSGPCLWADSSVRPLSE